MKKDEDSVYSNILLKTRIGLVVFLVLLAGCNSLGIDEVPGQSPEPSPTDSPTYTSNITEIETPVETETTTATQSNPDNWSEERKYRFFASSYRKNIPDDEVNISNTTVWARNDTMRITYIMKEPQNASQQRLEDAHLLITYSNMADFYLNESSPMSIDWIPKRLNIKALDPENRHLYYRAYTNYSIMNKYRTGKTEYSGYVFAYYSTIERGPANPDYDDG